MTTVVKAITANNQVVEIPLRSKNIGGAIEVAFDGDLGGGVITAYRRFYNDAGTQVGADIPLAYSWTNQTAAQLSGNFAGFTLEHLIQESSIVFKITGATAPSGQLLLLGLAS